MNKERWLKNHVSGTQKINLDTIIKKNITHIVAMHRQVVVEDYTLGDETGYHLTVIDAGRMWFDLKNYTGYKGK